MMERERAAGARVPVRVGSKPRSNAAAAGAGDCAGRDLQSQTCRVLVTHRPRDRGTVHSDAAGEALAWRLQPLFTMIRRDERGGAGKGRSPRTSPPQGHEAWGWVEVPRIFLS